MKKLTYAGLILALLGVNTSTVLLGNDLQDHFLRQWNLLDRCKEIRRNLAPETTGMDIALESALLHYHCTVKLDISVLGGDALDENANGRRRLEDILYNETIDVSGPYGNYRILAARELAESMIQIGLRPSGHDKIDAYGRDRIRRIKNASIREAALNAYDVAAETARVRNQMGEGLN